MSVAPALTLDAPSREPVPPALTPPPGNPRFPLMDALRAVAALSVLVYHVGFFGRVQQTHGYGAALAGLSDGVAIFFVLSGFLLYRPFFAAQLDGRAGPRIVDYARRRVLRVLPGYWVALTVLAVFPGLVGVFSGDWWRYYGLLQGYASQTLVRASGIPVAWSLGIEVSFYAALPLFAVLSRRLSARRDAAAQVRGQLIVLATLAVLSLLLGWVRLGNATPPWLPTFFDWFAFGMALAVLSAGAERGVALPRMLAALSRRPLRAWALALGAYALITVLAAGAPQNFLYSDHQAAADHLLRGVMAALIVLPAALPSDGDSLPARILSAPLLRWLGLISYGIFLWHLPLIMWMHAHGVHSGVALLVLALLWTVACAAASYYLVERPLLRFKDRPHARRPPSGRP